MTIYYPAWNVNPGPFRGEYLVTDARGNSHRTAAEAAAAVAMRQDGDLLWRWEAPKLVGDRVFIAGAYRPCTATGEFLPPMSVEQQRQHPLASAYLQPL